MRLTVWRLALLALLVLSCLLAPWRSEASAAPPPAAPGPATQAIRSELYAAQNALLARDQTAALAASEQAESLAEPLLSQFTADPDAAAAAHRAFAAASAAIAADDASALAIAQGELWAALMVGSAAETLAAIETGDATRAAAWLLARDYRPTTRLSRPDADATLAVRDLANGTIDRETALAAVRADLLDTYQATADIALTRLAQANPGSLTAVQARGLGQVIGIWPLLAAAYVEHEGADAGARATDTMVALRASALARDAAPFTQHVADATAIVQSFRAAPLSAEEQARRGGQLLRYLALVPVEYGRGVKQGQVLLELEVQEAVAFQDAARAAFADVRLPLRERDAARTEAIEHELRGLSDVLAATARRDQIADPGEIESRVATVTRELTAIFPPAWTQMGGAADFDVVRTLLDQVEASLAAGQPQQAESARLEAYAIFETGPEKRLLAFAPDTAQRVEQLFWEGDGSTPGLHALIANGASVPQLHQTRTALETALTDAQNRLGAGQVAPAAIVVNAATIVFREGLEAILILASLLASMVGANARFKRPLAAGALAALAVTALLFVVAREALAALSPYSEVVEAVVSVLAIAVLLVVMNWFFHKVYWTRWIAGHHDRRRKLLIGGAAGQMLGLVLLGFTSVFREGAETVLFLQALVFDAGTGVVLAGVGLGLAATLVVGVLTLVLQTKLPHKKMLVVTGFMIAFVLVTMVGGTVHTLQIVGWLPITAVPALQDLPYWLGVWFGVFPTWQGLLAQLAAVVVVIGSYVVAESAHARSATPWQVLGGWLGMGRLVRRA